MSLLDATPIGPYLAAIKIGACVIAIVGVLGTVGWFVWKWQDMKQTIQLKEQAIQGLTLQNNSNKLVIEELHKNQAAVDGLRTEYEQSQQQTQTMIFNLQGKLQKLNLGQAAVNDTQNAEKNINDIFHNTTSCLTVATKGTGQCVN